MAKATGTQFTVQGPRGWSRPAYGSFAGKVESVVVIAGNTIGCLYVDAVRTTLAVNAVNETLKAKTYGC